MPEPEPEIWVPAQQTYFVEQASCTKNNVFLFLLDHIVLELEPQTFRGWSRSLKFEFRLHSPGPKSSTDYYRLVAKRLMPGVWTTFKWLIILKFHVFLLHAKLIK